MRLRVTVAYEYELPDDPVFLEAEYGTTVPAEVAEINRSHNEAIDVIGTLDALESVAEPGVRQVQYTIVPVQDLSEETLEDRILGPVPETQQ